MKENKDKKHEVKTFYLYTGIVIVVILSVLLIGLLIYCYWKSKITDEAVGYNPINSVIAFLALILNILTVIFVYATYQTQRDTIKMQAKQINDDKKDGEFNRVLDIVYKQLEHTIEKYNSKINSGWTYKQYFEQLSHLLTTSSFNRIVHPNSDIPYYFGTVFNSFLVKEFEVYYRVINLNNQLSDDDKTFFTNLFVNNIDNRIINKVMLFQELYYDFQQSEQYSVLKKDDPSSRFDFIESRLKLVLQYLKIPKKEGLRLD